MFSYILQVTLCWSAFYLLYLVLLRKETFFHINRWYLLGTLAIGLLIPLIEWQPNSVIEDHRTYEIAIEPIQLQIDQLEQSIEAASQSPLLNWTDICLAIYLSGMLFFIALLLHGLWKIWKLYRAGEGEQQGDIKVVYTNESHLPFSFFNCLFWSKHFEAEHKEKAQILRHEEAHIYQWHTLDVLFLEVLNILFWCSPIIYFYRKSLRTTHEYLADALVLQDTKRKEYGHLLLKQSLSGIQIALANHFIHSQLKNRILMMTRNKSRKRNLMKYLPFLPILLLAILVFSKHEGRVHVEKAVASLMKVEKKPFDEKEITEHLEKLADTYLAFANEGILGENSSEFTLDYKDLMETYDNSEREIAELTKMIFGEHNILVDYSVNALTEVARIRFINGTEANTVFSIFFDEESTISIDDIAIIEKRLYELAEIYQRFGCCDANPEAPHEHFASDYGNFLDGFEDSKQKLQVAHLTQEVFKEHLINVDLNLTDLNGNKNYVLNEISFNTEKVSRVGEAREFTIYINNKERADTWEVTFTEFMKMHLKKYERAFSEEDQQEAMNAFEAEHQRWLGMYPDKIERINEIVEEVKKYSLYVKEQLDYKGFLPYYKQILKAENVQQQADAIQQLANYTDDLYDENSHDYNKVLNAAYRAAYEAFGSDGLPIEFRVDGEKRIILYWMAGDTKLTTYQHENDPRHLKEYEADFVIMHRLDPSPRDEQRTYEVMKPLDHNENWKDYTVNISGIKKNITDNDSRYYGFMDGWEDRFSYTNDRVQVKFASTFREEKVNTRFIHPIKDQSKVTREMGYGMRMHPIFKKKQLHTGVDYVVPMNTEIVATADGKVVAVKNWQKGYGLHLTIEHENGYATFYAHLEKSLAKVGQSVKQGEVIALSGNTGTSTGPHLHYEVRKDGKAIDFEKEEATKSDTGHKVNKGSLESGMLEFHTNDQTIKVTVLDENAESNDPTDALTQFVSNHLTYDLKTIESSFAAVFGDPNLTLEDRNKMLSEDYRLYTSRFEDKREEIENSLRKVVFMRGFSVEVSDNYEVYLYKKDKETAKSDVDEMPRFPSKECEALKSIEAKRNCSNQALIQYIYTNIKYPAAARKAGIEGINLVRFKVMLDGSLEDIRLLRNIGGGCGEEAKRVIEKMNADNLRWIPGKKDGKNVAVEFTIPVNFKLTDDPPKTEGEELFKVVEQMPRFPSEKCEQLATDEEKRKCSSGALMEYLFKNIKYPKAAKEAGKEGMCVVQFVVEKDGNLSDIKLLRNIGYGLGEESKRVIEQMNEDGLRWISGIQRGRKVRVQFNLPIRFALTDDSKETVTEKFDPTPELPSQKLALTAFNAAPNPSNGELRLQFEGTAKPLTIKVYDANGKVIFEEQVQNFDGHFDQQIEVRKSIGVHFLAIEQEGKVFVEQLVIQ